MKLDNGVNQDKVFSFLAVTTRKFIVCIVVMVAVNLVLAYFRPNPNYPIHNLDGTTVTSAIELKKASFTFVVMGLPMISFLVALVVALLPFRGVGYGERYVRFGLVILLALHFMVMVLSLLRIAGMY